MIPRSKRPFWISASGWRRAKRRTIPVPRAVHLGRRKNPSTAIDHHFDRARPAVDRLQHDQLLRPRHVPGDDGHDPEFLLDSRWLHSVQLPRWFSHSSFTDGPVWSPIAPDALFNWTLLLLRYGDHPASCRYSWLRVWCHGLHFPLSTVLRRRLAPSLMVLPV